MSPRSSAPRPRGAVGWGVRRTAALLALWAASAGWAAALAATAAEPVPAASVRGAAGAGEAAAEAEPVRWLEWGPEAFRRARREGRPVFLSIGYPACEWCAAMDEEVFADPQVAGLLNSGFVSVKVDRELRPDIDRIYLAATQLLCGRAGWPISVFLTPDMQPFFAGTYFPLRDTYEERGFPAVLAEMRDAWTLRRAEVLKVAGRVGAAIVEAEYGGQAPPMPPDTVLIARALALIEGRYDGAHGGFGSAPKFPSDVWLGFVMADPERCQEARFREMVHRTLDGMEQGGIHDQVQGGFLRYALDAGWQVPHFEKTLPTQAGVAELYATAFALEPHPSWERALRRLLAFVQAEMMDADGGFCSAVYAAPGTAAAECCCWSKEELAAVLGPAVDELLAVYALAPAACESGGVLYRRQGWAGASEADARTGVGQPAVEQLLERLRAHRQQRFRRAGDCRVVTAWHAMMLRAFVQAAGALRDSAYLHTAARAGRFARTHLQLADGTLARYRGAAGPAGRGLLEDYAQLVRAYVALASATGDRRWVRQAEALTAAMVARFWDPSSSSFFLQPPGPDMLVRCRSAEDGAGPAASATAVHALLDLAGAAERRAYLDYAAAALTAYGGAMRARPEGHVHLIAAAERYLRDYAPAGAGAPELYLTPPAAGRRSPVPLAVRVELRPDRPAPGEEFAADVHLDIGAGWQIGANPAGDPDLTPLSVRLDANVPVELIDVHYPPGTPSAQAAGAARLYPRPVTVRAALRLPAQIDPHSARELRLRLHYQACRDGHCQPPSELVRSVPLQLEVP